jgi:pyruvate/2-oxoglutarate dehydrogenase complex dihydrolipoamide dehydrogenase (E3) component
MSAVYDVIVIGGGAAGLTAAAFNGELGRRIALVERDRIGGDCTWVGCVPSKALLKVAKVAHSARTADRYGIAVSEPVIDMMGVRDHVQRAIHEVYRHETPAEVARRGIEVVRGEARFVDAHAIEVDERKLRAKKIIIATGGRAAVPPIPGLDEVPYSTNRDFFDNDRLPRHLLVMGAGPIGMEMGQAYARLGAEVTIVGQQIMPRDEPEAVAVLKQVFQDEGIAVIETRVTAVCSEGGEIALALKDGQTVRGDMLLVAVGRIPNIETLALEKAGVTYTQQGILVNDHLQTQGNRILNLNEGQWLLKNRGDHEP